MGNCRREKNKNEGAEGIAKKKRAKMRPFWFYNLKINASYRITDNGIIVQGLQGVNLSQDQLLRIQQQVRFYAMQGAYYAMQGVVILHYAECRSVYFVKTTQLISFTT